MFKIHLPFITLCIALSPFVKVYGQESLSYPIVDTGQTNSYDNHEQINTPSQGEAFFGQDSSYLGNQAAYHDNQDGTVTDKVTGLMWQKALGGKWSLAEAVSRADSTTTGGYTDWRVPTIKELYSLIQFTGQVKGQNAIRPFIDTRYFPQPLGLASEGDREIDAQVWSSTEYVGKTMGHDATVFGVNFVDGRIKGYPKKNPRTHQSNKMYFRFVRGNADYGHNRFKDNGDGTVSDLATGLMWQKEDSKVGMPWQQALSYSQNLTLGGHSDWRLPNAKELQSIVDYSRSPETSDSPAIDPIFSSTEITNENGDADYPYYWTSTTHLDGPRPAGSAVYVAFGKALGKMHGRIMDVHGAGAQRSDPKTGKSMSRGPQGDFIRVNNFIRSVRGGVAKVTSSQVAEQTFQYDAEDMSLAKSTHKQMAKRPGQSANNFIKRLDRNNDHLVSFAEFHHNQQEFDHFDLNKDGYISLEEAPTGPPQ